MPTPTTVPFNELIPDEGNVRSTMDTANIKELAGSIESVGLINPIRVRRDGDRIVIVSGHRRHAAYAHLVKAKKLDADHPIKVTWSDATEGTVTVEQLIENLHREDISPFDEARGYLRLTTEFAFTQKQLAQAVGRSQPHISKRLSLLSLSPEEEAAYTKGLLSLEDAYLLSTLPASTAKKLRERIVSGQPVGAYEVQSEVSKFKTKEQVKAFKAALAERMIEVIPAEKAEYDRSLYELLGDFTIDTLKDYVPKKDDVVTFPHYMTQPDRITVRRKRTPAQQRKHEEAIQQAQAARTAEPPKPDPTSPLEEWEYAVDDAITAHSARVSDVKAERHLQQFLAVSAQPAKWLTKHVLTIMSNYPWSHFQAERLVTLLRLPVPEEQLDKPTYARGYLTLLRDWILEDPLSRGMAVWLFHSLTGDTFDALAAETGVELVEWPTMPAPPTTLSDGSPAPEQPAPGTFTCEDCGSTDILDNGDEYVCRRCLSTNMLADETDQDADEGEPETETLPVPVDAGEAA